MSINFAYTLLVFKLLNSNILYLSVIARKRRLLLTEHGELISGLPFTCDEAGTFVYGAKKGYLHESLALVAIKSAKPFPITQAFGDDEANRLNLSRYFPMVDIKNPQSVAVANLAAYIYWYFTWNKIRRHEMQLVRLWKRF